WRGDGFNKRRPLRNLGLGNRFVIPAIPVAIVIRNHFPFARARSGRPSKDSVPNPKQRPQDKRRRETKQDELGTRAHYCRAFCRSRDSSAWRLRQCEKPHASDERIKYARYRRGPGWIFRKAVIQTA